MAMPARPKLWTVDMVRALPEDGRRHELIDGVHIVSPSPILVHQRAGTELLLCLAAYLKETRVGQVVYDSDLVFDRHNMLEPDLLVLPTASAQLPQWWENPGAALLVVEILSPSTAYRDRGKKREKYLAGGVPDYWIVDLKKRLIERWKPGYSQPEMIKDALTWQPNPAFPPFDLDVTAFFAEALDAT